MRDSRLVLGISHRCLAIRPRTLFAALALLVLAAAACAGSGDDSSAKTASFAEPAERPDRVPLIEGPRSPGGVKAILGTGDLGVGSNRVGFVLTSLSGFVTEPEVSVSSRYFATEDSEGTGGETVTAQFRPWPYGSRGLYSTQLDFDRAGRWGLDVAVKNKDGGAETATLFFEVLEKAAAPTVGDPAIRSESKTVADVDSLDEISTGSLQDEDLYQTTLADAVESDTPTVVVFASPAFCTNAVCGPQVETLQRLKDAYKGQANFIHVDFYDNPVEIEGDLDRAVLSPTVIEWNLPSIEWTFVVDSDGRVTARFEAYATYDELEQALLQVL